MMQAIVEYLVHEKRLYEGVNRKRSNDGQMMEFHNAVFLGLDETGQPRNAFQRGLATTASYKGEVEGGQKEFPFHIPGRPDTDTVFVFEASIDAMSHGVTRICQTYKDRARLSAYQQAREEGKVGRPSKNEQVAQALKMLGSKCFTINEIEKLSGVSRATLYRYKGKEQ